MSTAEQSTNVKLVPVDAVQRFPGNPRRGDIPRIKASLEAFGQYRSIVVQESTGYILAGNHTYAAILELGWPLVEVKYVDVDDQTARRILAADNRTADEADYDNQELASLLEGIDDLAGTGFVDSDLQELLDSIQPPGERDKDSSGSLLALADIAVGEPRHQVKDHAIYKVGRHYLLICDVIRDHARWREVLARGETEHGTVLFVPYPGPYTALTDKARDYLLVMVQPDHYLAGHLLDKYAAIHGDESILELDGPA